MAKPTAVVVGVGAERGIGAAVCRRFAREGYHVLVSGRTAAKIEGVAAAIRAEGHSAEAVLCDTTVEAEVVALFDRAMAPDGIASYSSTATLDDLDRNVAGRRVVALRGQFPRRRAGDDDESALPSSGETRAPAEVVVFNAGNNAKLDFRHLSAEQFEHYWRVGCFGGFLVGREAARRLAPLGRGTVIFTGASGSLRGKPGFAHFAVAKAGLRMLAQSMAREFGPMGLHVAHVIIDGGVDGERLRRAIPGMVEQLGAEGLLDPDAIAENYWQLHRQPRSAWTQELDLRPFRENY